MKLTTQMVARMGEPDEHARDEITPQGPALTARPYRLTVWTDICSARAAHRASPPLRTGLNDAPSPPSLSLWPSASACLPPGWPVWRQACWQPSCDHPWQPPRPSAPATTGYPTSRSSSPPQARQSSFPRPRRASHHPCHRTWCSTNPPMTSTPPCRRRRGSACSPLSPLKSVSYHPAPLRRNTGAEMSFFMVFLPHEVTFLQRRVRDLL